jgi:hypothetical protein
MGEPGSNVRDRRSPSRSEARSHHINAHGGTMKTMRVTLEIDVDDLPADERKRHAEEMEMSVDDIPALANTEAREAAEPLEYIGGDIITDLFAGTDTFVTYKDVRVLAAEYVETGARSR